MCLRSCVSVTLAPAPIIPIDCTVRLKAEVFPSYAVAGGTWLSHTGSPLLTDVSSGGTLLTKLPRVTPSDSGTYTCSISVDGQSRKPVYNYTLDVTVYGEACHTPEHTSQFRSYTVYVLILIQPCNIHVKTM